MSEIESKEAQQSSQISRILSLTNDANLFLSDEGTPFVEFQVKDHFEVWPISSETTAQIIQNRYFSKFKKIPNRKTLDDALMHLGFLARKNPREKVFNRIAKLEDKIFIDLGNAVYDCVEITTEGWKIIPRSPAKFFRSSGTLALPYPTENGSIESLHESLNLESKEDFILTLAFTLGSLFLSNEYPILILQGPQGSTKSTTSTILKKLIDPTKPILRSLPKSESDLFIAAKNSHLVTFDNLSGINAAMSDSICKLATGCGISTRKLYTNHEEVFIELSRPLVINGIDDLSARADLADRSVVLHLPKVPEDKRISSSDFWKRFDENYSAILGCLYSAVSHGLKNRSNTKLSEKPRMADFAQTACACLGYFGIETEDTRKALMENRSEIAKDAVESNTVGRAIRGLCQRHSYWKGSATDLLNVLCEVVSDDERRSHYWPKSPQNLSRELNRIAPSLKSHGIEVQFFRSSSKRELVISKGQKIPSQASLPSFPDSFGPMTVTAMTIPNDEKEVQ